MTNRIDRSRALWNRQDANLESDETLAQLLDRGEMTVWREVFPVGPTRVQLWRRFEGIVFKVPLKMAPLLLAAPPRPGGTGAWNVPISHFFLSEKPLTTP